ncbi:MAG: 4Fe-4S binding protein [Ignavibacteriales bacterium]
MAHYINNQCNGCTLCSRMCPVSAIEGEQKGLHTINAARCVDCGVCGRVCAKDAVLNEKGSPVAKLPRKEWPRPQIDQGLCSACAICVDACGKNALAISMPKFKGDLRVYAYLADEKACVGCNICAKECPLKGIRMGVAG